MNKLIIIIIAFIFLNNCSFNEDSKIWKNKDQDLSQDQNIKQIFALTTKAEHWFLEKGFVRGEKQALPNEKIQTYEPARNSLILIKYID